MSDEREGQLRVIISEETAPRRCDAGFTSQMAIYLSGFVSEGIKTYREVAKATGCCEVSKKIRLEMVCRHNFRSCRALLPKVCPRPAFQMLSSHPSD